MRTLADATTENLATDRDRVTKNKLLLLAAIAIAVGLFFAFDLGRFLSLEYMKAQQASFAAWYGERPGTVIGAYFAIYVVVTLEDSLLDSVDAP